MNSEVEMSKKTKSEKVTDDSTQTQVEKEGVEQEEATPSPDSVQVADELFQNRLKKAEQMTRKRVYAAVGAGLIPFPVVDFVALTGIQMELIRSLCKLYDLPFNQEMGKTLVTSLIGGALPLHTRPALASLVKNIPLIGTTTGAITLSLVGGACTYAIGKIFIQHFEAGGNLLNFNPEKMRSYFQSYYQDGETVASEASTKK